MSLTPTFCEDCANVHLDTVRWSFERWACSKFPVVPGFNPVAPTKGLPDPPYNRCVNINKGFCPVFKPKDKTDDTL